MSLSPVHTSCCLKKQFLFSVIILISHCCCSQSLPEEDLWKGLERFRLGNSKTACGNRLIRVEGGTDSTGKEKTYQYSYDPGPDSPVIFTGIRFNMVSLKFNDSGKLKAIELIAFYSGSNRSQNQKDAEKYSKQVLDYFETRLGKGRRTDHPDETGWRIAREYEWKKDNLRLIFTQHIKKAKNFLQSGSTISVWLSDSH